jgi:hypothetical protein
MTFASLLAVWMALSAVGIAVIYRIALRIERWSPAISFTSLVLLGPVVLIASWMAAHQIVRVDQAACEQMDPSVDRLRGMSPLPEFRAKCIATKDNSEWLALRKW